ncbi:MAG: hypothetical protein SA339_08375 [Methanomassiliicoccus sp.]|nr:hypothetical protein [Methanomassiliicoccus sp.]
MIEDFITGFVILLGCLAFGLILAGEILLWKKIPGWGFNAHLARMAAFPILMLGAPPYLGVISDEKEETRHSEGKE